MTEKDTNIVTANPWGGLRRFTPARIALGRSGTSLPTEPHLDFQLAHARARKAVHHELDHTGLARTLEAAGHDVIQARSAVSGRAEYLQRPDKGRRLDEASRDALASRSRPARPYDAAFVIGDGLSSLAIQGNAHPLISAIVPKLRATDWHVAPLVLVKDARVAIADEVAEILGAELAVILIGERPGLSSPDSMGIYMTYRPRVGLTDESRNCISNVRPEGLAIEAAAFKLMYLMNEARRRKLSGVELKDESDALAAPASASAATLGKPD